MGLYVKKVASILLPCVMFTGCMNMPTPPSQITGAYASGLKYDSFKCSQLGAELSSLSRRENQLIAAQRQRLKTSEIQAFWYGYGQGDGIEASELANVRGEREAVRRALDSKGCKYKIIKIKQVEPVKKKVDEYDDY